MRPSKINQISIQIDDPSAYAYLRIGKCHQSLGNDKLAIQYYKKSVQEDPSSEKSWDCVNRFLYSKRRCQKKLCITLRKHF